MDRKINIYNKELCYKLRKTKRSKKMRIIIGCDASVVLSIPHNVSEVFAQNFLKEKSDWVFKKVAQFQKNIQPVGRKYTRKDYLANKEGARNLVEAKIQKFNSFYEFEFNRFAIRNQKTRWGSCSKNKNLNFNYKLIYLPDEIAEYIVVHELCHLREFNHSKKFWDIVERFIPNYKELRKQLRKTNI